jgi:predicted DsbA family dithiol-disulfide isomerase
MPRVAMQPPYPARPRNPANRTRIPSVGQNRTMSLKIPVAHDFVCPWCWVAVHQMERLRREFEVEFEWLGYELWPADLPRPVAEPPRVIPTMPPIPTRLDLMLATENMELPPVERPKRMNSHKALLAAEYAKVQGLGEPFILELYRAFWERGEFISETEYLCNEAGRLGMDPESMRNSIESEEFADKVVGFDAPAYKTGIFHVPTFIIDGKRYAEQPYRVLEKAVASATKDSD